MNPERNQTVFFPTLFKAFIPPCPGSVFGCLFYAALFVKLGAETIFFAPSATFTLLTTRLSSFWNNSEQWRLTVTVRALLWSGYSAIPVVDSDSVIFCACLGGSRTDPTETLSQTAASSQSCDRPVSLVTMTKKDTKCA